MKKYIKYQAVAIAAVAILGSGCGEKFLDTAIDQWHTPETLETTSTTIWYFANSMYAPMEYGLTTLNGNLFAGVTDEAQETVPSSPLLAFTQGSLGATNNPLSTRYLANYEGIRAANFFLDYVADGNGEALLTQNRDIVRDKVNYEKDLRYLGYTRAEAQVLKAYYYGELIKMYGGVPIVESTYPQNPDKLYLRSSYDEVVSYAVRLIDDNIAGMATDWSEDVARKGRLIQDVALAIKARILLYAASPRDNTTGDVDKWKAAADAADAIIALGKYTLDADYGAYFKGSRTLTSAETILAVRKPESNTLERLNYPIATQGGGSALVPTHSLVEAYESLMLDLDGDGDPEPVSDPEDWYYGKDPRLAATIVYQGSQWNGRTIDQTPGGTDDQSARKASPTGYYLKKFLQENLDLRQSAVAQHNWPVYRYAEVLLNFAEAANEVGGPDAAGWTMTPKAALQMVRDRASTNLPAIDPNISKEDFRTLVKRERQVELAFEGHRYWDLLRWKDAETVLNRPVKGIKITGSIVTEQNVQQNVVDVATRHFDASKNYYMPFSKAEIISSNGTLTQNEGY
jgi:hypothetical protein